MALMTMVLGGLKTATKLGAVVALVVFPGLAWGAAEPAEPPIQPPAGAAAESSPTNDECLGCHGNSVDRSKGRAIPAVSDTFPDSVHGQINLACVDCHTDLQGKDLPHAEKLAKPNCSQCHEDAVKAYNLGVHAGSRRKSSGSDAAWCSDCHGIHDIRSSKESPIQDLPLQHPRHMQQVPRRRGRHRQGPHRDW